MNSLYPKRYNYLFLRLFYEKYKKRKARGQISEVGGQEKLPRRRQGFAGPGKRFRRKAVRGVLIQNSPLLNVASQPAMRI